MLAGRSPTDLLELLLCTQRCPIGEPIPLLDPLWGLDPLSVGAIDRHSSPA